MNLLIMFSFLLFCFMLFFMILSLNFFFFNNFLTMEWIIMKFNSMNFSFLIYLDFYSSLFLMTVSLISMIVMIYSIEYMNNDKFLNRFSNLTFLFVISMYLMILSPSILSILLGWDMLGLISYCLVIYYQNLKSYNSGMLTIVCNRIGDVGILMLISMSILNGSWNLMFYKFNKLMLILLIIIAFTKSAQIPFSLWLPAAMTAPTPISSLVHSSTLVTAGVYLLIRYNKFLFMNNFNMYILLISSITMFMAGLMANFEFDFKKIIALSTLSQLSLMMSILSLGFWELAFFHLIIHALFKSLMFLCAGSFIHYFNNNQDIRKYGGLIFYYPFKTLIFILSLMCLSGFPFLSAYFSKDLIMEILIFKKMNLISLMFLLISTVLTISYSIRLMMFILFSKKNYNVNLFKKESFLMNICMFILLLMIIFSGYLYINMFNFNYIIILSKKYKFMMFKIIMIGIILGMYFFYKNFNKSKFNLFINEMFFLQKMFNIYELPMYKFKNYEIFIDKKYFEYKFKILYIKMKFKFFYSFEFKFLIFLSMIMISLLVMILMT